MSYLVLARKWRPHLFGDLVGQQHVARTLENAIRQEQVAHAYLFTGPRGVGKTSAARILAAALNCDKGPTPEPCGACLPCREIAAGRSLDVLEIDGASNRGIDEIRDLRENVRYMASAGKRKIYIIDEVHMLTTEAFNALLKTLEEPPSHVLFLFATTRPTKVPATILSRTIRFDFRRIDGKGIVGRLRTIVESEKIEAEDRALHMIARAADGSMRDALSLLEQARSYGGGRLTAAETEEALGVVDEKMLFDVSAAARASDVPAVLEAIHGAVDRGRDPIDLLHALEGHFRDLLVARVSDDPARLIDGAEETIERYRDEARHFEPDDLIRMLTLLGEGGRELRFSPKPRLLLEMLLLRLVRMDSTVPLGEILKRLDGGSAAPSAPRPSVRSEGAAPKRQRTGGATGARRAAPSGGGGSAEKKKRAKKGGAEEEGPAPGGDESSPRLFRAKWGEFLAHLGAENASLASLLRGSAPGKAGSGFLEIAFPREAAFQMEQALDRSNREDLERAFAGFFRSPCRLRGVLDAHAEAPAPSSTRKKDLRKDPRIGRILDMLDGEII